MLSCFRLAALVFLLPVVFSPPVHAHAVKPKYPTQEEATQFAKTLEQGISRGDVKVWIGAFDFDIMEHNVVPGLGNDVPYSSEIVKALHTGVSKIGQDLIQSEYRFLRVHGPQDKPRLFFRVVSKDGAFDYHDLSLQKVEGKTVIADVNVLSVNENYSIVVRDELVPGSAVLKERGVWERLTGKLDPEIVQGRATAKKIHGLVKAEKYKEALAAYEQLPKNFKTNRINLRHRLAISRNIDAEHYQKALADFQRQFSYDPAVDLLMIRTHLANGEHAKAAEAVLRLDAKVSDKAFLAGERERILALSKTATSGK